MNKAMTWEKLRSLPCLRFTVFFLYTIILPAIAKMAPAINTTQRTICVLSPVCGELVLLLFVLFESTELPVTVVADCFFESDAL